MADGKLRVDAEPPRSQRSVSGFVSQGRPGATELDNLEITLEDSLLTIQASGTSPTTPLSSTTASSAATAPSAASGSDLPIAWDSGTCCSQSVAGRDRFAQAPLPVFPGIWDVGTWGAGLAQRWGGEVALHQVGRAIGDLRGRGGTPRLARRSPRTRRERNEARSQVSMPLSLRWSHGDREPGPEGCPDNGLLTRPDLDAGLVPLHDSFADYRAGAAVAHAWGSLPGPLVPGQDEQVLFAVQIAGSMTPLPTASWSESSAGLSSRGPGGC